MNSRRTDCVGRPMRSEPVRRPHVGRSGRGRPQHSSCKKGCAEDAPRVVGLGKPAEICKPRVEPGPVMTGAEHLGPVRSWLERRAPAQLAQRAPLLLHHRAAR